MGGWVASVQFVICGTLIISYRERDKLDVVVDGNTTFSSPIAARLGSKH